MPRFFLAPCAVRDAIEAGGQPKGLSFGIVSGLNDWCFFQFSRGTITGAALSRDKNSYWILLLFMLHSTTYADFGLVEKNVLCAIMMITTGVDLGSL